MGTPRRTLVVLLAAAALLHPPRLGAEAPAGVAALRPDPAWLASAAPELRARLREDPFIYFRSLNTPWAGRVCEAFRADLRSLPTAVLHGDAHVGQYAVTATAYGLDDFDDAARGPSVVDMVRFLGSVDLITRRRGWAGDRERLFDRFFDGYLRALSDPSYMPPEPAVVARLRARPQRTQAQFLAWAESLMLPAAAGDLPYSADSLEPVERFVRTQRPEIPVGYFRLKRFGRLHMGVGSALTRKVLARIEGPSPAPDDDRIIEIQELSSLNVVPCVQVPASGEAFRIIAAAEQIGRLRYDILVAPPRRQEPGTRISDTWVHTWDPTYKEVVVADFSCPDDLGEVAQDVGAQLGASRLREQMPALAQPRQAEIEGVRRLAPRIRATARQLTNELLAGWEELRASK
jgi:hypothetical protein